MVLYSAPTPGLLTSLVNRNDNAMHFKAEQQSNIIAKVCINPLSKISPDCSMRIVRPVYIQCTDN